MLIIFKFQMSLFKIININISLSENKIHNKKESKSKLVLKKNPVFNIFYLLFIVQYKTMDIFVKYRANIRNELAASMQQKQPN